MATTKERVITTAVEKGVFTFKVKGAGELKFDSSKASKENQEMARLLGWRQRVSNGAALDKGATPKEKLTEMQRLVDHFESGSKDWALGKGERTPIELKALANVQRLEISIVKSRMIEVCKKKGITERQFLNKLAQEKAIQEEVARLRQDDGPEVEVDIMSEMMAENGEESEGESK